ncbi:MAG: hypothetical protein IID44_23005 [Planctomycetes bacterium]|nr:hypothetical protein [Planctomycetota bacterium]
MKYMIAMLLIGCVMVRAASAELIITTDTTLDFRIGQLEGPVQIFDGPDSPTTVEIVDGAHITPNIHVRGQSILNMRGGITESFILGHDNSTINIFGGDVAKGEDIEMDDNSVANIYGGHFGDDIEAQGSATVNLYGGTFEKAGDGATLVVQQDGVINVYLREYEIFPLPPLGGLPRLVGVLSDGSEIDVTLFVDSFNLRDGEIVFHTVIPEPDSLVLALIAVIVLAGLVRATPCGIVRRTKLR